MMEADSVPATHFGKKIILILGQLSQRFLGNLTKEQFYFSLMAVGSLIILFLFTFKNNASSKFKVREADIKRQKSSHKNLSEHRIKFEKQTLLPGIRLDAAPHELLGVSKDASAKEINKAYREKMKQYHPDKTAPPDTQAWRDAQIIAEAINKAKESLLKTRKL